MGYKEEYLLSEYQELVPLNESESVHIVRNKQNGLICVKKPISMENKGIFDFLKNHPNRYMPRIYECLELNESFIIIEEYITGDHLGNLVEKEAFTEKEALQIVEELCCALRILHHAEPPIICRDLKAENIMLTDKNEIKLVDFDIARRYKKGLKKDTCLMGTEGYAAPEQYGYKQTDCRTDIYALGVLLNYLILKTFPIEKIVDGSIGEIVQKCIEIDPDKRYQSVEELSRAILKTGIVKEQLNDEFTFEKKTVCQGKRNEHRIPGFRTGKLWKNLLAIMGYIFITYICFTTEIIKEGEILTGSILRMEQFFMWIGHIIFIFLVFDYFHLNKKIILLRSNHWILKMIGYVLSYLAIIAISVVICMIFEMILF